MDENNRSQKLFFDAYRGMFRGDFVSAVLLRIAARYINDSVLDVGAGSGALVEILRKRNLNAIGVDICARPPFVQEGAVTNLPYKEQSFGTVFCTELLEHLTSEEARKGLIEIYRVMREKGFLIVTVPYREDLNRNTITCPKCGHEFHRYCHVRSYDETSITEEIKRAGFYIKLVKIYALGAMAKIPFGRYFNFIFKMMKFEILQKSIVVIAQKR